MPSLCQTTTSLQSASMIAANSSHEVFVNNAHSVHTLHTPGQHCGHHFAWPAATIQAAALLPTDRWWSSGCAEPPLPACPSPAVVLRRCGGGLHSAAAGGAGAPCLQLPEGQSGAEVLVQAPPEMHSPGQRVHGARGGLEVMPPSNIRHCGLPCPSSWPSQNLKATPCRAVSCAVVSCMALQGGTSMQE